MADDEARPKAKEEPASSPPPEPSPLTRMANLTRRVLQVPKEEAVRPKKTKRRHA